MPADSEATRLNLEYYRKQAKGLLKAAKLGDPAALQRISRHAVRCDPAAPALHDAQLTIAREQGFASWPRFHAYVVESGQAPDGLVAEFIDAAVSDLRRAKEILAAHPQIADAGFYVDLVLGNSHRIERVLAETPGLAVGPSGSQNCEPLLYVCFSRFANGRSDRAEAFAETARILLSNGADPNTAFVPEDLPDNPLSCLYAATGLNNNRALGLVLLEAGANPNDGESLYHSTEHWDLACMKLLLSHGATLPGSNALKHLLDREDMEGLRLLLAAGVDPNETNERGETALHWAVWRGRSAEAVAALLESGAELDARRADGRTAYALAVQNAQTETAALLAKRGANLQVSAMDLFMGAAMSVTDPNELKLMLATQPEIAASPEHERLIPDLASHHRTAAVRALLLAGFPIGARGELGATALHWACWKGYSDLVDLLLKKGASLTVEDHQFHGTPPGWFGHGVRNCHEGGGDYPGVARLLIAAGAAIPAADLPTGNPEVDEVLREHGLL